jgi:hypothetical protein
MSHARATRKCTTYVCSTNDSFFHFPSPDSSCSSPHPSPQCLLHFLFPGRFMHLLLNPPFLFSLGIWIESWQSFNLQVIFNLWVHTILVFPSLVTHSEWFSLVPPIGLQFHIIVFFFFSNICFIVSLLPSSTSTPPPLPRAGIMVLRYCTDPLLLLCWLSLTNGITKLKKHIWTRFLIRASWVCPMPVDNTLTLGPCLTAWGKRGQSYQNKLWKIQPVPHLAQDIWPTPACCSSHRLNTYKRHTAWGLQGRPRISPITEDIDKNSSLGSPSNTIFPHSRHLGVTAWVCHGLGLAVRRQL